MQVLSAYLTSYARDKGIPGSLISVIETIAQCCVQINAKIRLGDLSGVLGEVKTENIQGERQKKLDIIANHLLITQLSQNSVVAGLASEEEDDFIRFNDTQEYLVLFDPLDGSSNVDVNISIGTIFSILKKPQGKLQVQHFLQAGTQQLAAGYVLYGPQTLLVLTFGDQVLMFTLNAQQDFILNIGKIAIPVDTQEFAINLSNQRFWDLPMQQYIDILLQGQSGPRARNYNMRWVASMVAEVHRILIRGGIFLYPKDSRQDTQNGKLRLLYEANPMSLLVKAAGGKAHSMCENILDIQPEALHQRVSVILGSSDEVNFVKQLHGNV